MSADEVATATQCHPRLVREWLDGQTAGGLIEYDPTADSYQLSAEGAMALADDKSPVFVARGMNTMRAIYLDLSHIHTKRDTASQPALSADASRRHQDHPLG